jgi:hypothetical protein
MLTVNETPAAIVVTGSGGVLRPAMQRVDPKDTAPDLRCGDTVNDALYALDVFLPLVNLKQESLCDVPPVPVSPAPGVSKIELGGGLIPKTSISISNRLEPEALTPLPLPPLPLNKSGFWRTAKALYALSGWLLSSLAILTFSGVFGAKNMSG